DQGIALDIQVVEELGAQRLIHGRLGDQEITLSQNAEEPVPSGKMSLSFAPEDAFLFDTETGQRI
ncbi:sn-glycerol-3-phosphate ABC transporter ATP-binding protein UgpC, partial [bacterium]|nr:sn-glycerol-3-phosphate ABC transporter ATP-binding protein UgpC [bacterium]